MSLSLNYHHLLYFWTVAKEGSIARACQRLHLAQPTISGQIKALERSLGERLFQRAGRGLALTDVGRLVFRYADEIFAVGAELEDALNGRPTGGGVRLAVGVADVLPKLICYRLLEPAMRMKEPVQITVSEDRHDRLLAELAVHNLDLVLSDAPVPPGTSVRVYNHLLGECGVSFFAAPAIAERVRRGFPQSLTGEPLLLPGEQTVLRRSLEQWLETNGIRPRIVGSFADSALMKVFGTHGIGIFPAPSAVEKDVQKAHDVELVGRLESVRERFYAISVERRLKHPAVLAITESARRRLFH